MNLIVTFVVLPSLAVKTQPNIKFRRVDLPLFCGPIIPITKIRDLSKQLQKYQHILIIKVAMIPESFCQEIMGKIVVVSIYNLKRVSICCK
jgi:hypothetical protein